MTPWSLYYSHFTDEEMYSEKFSHFWGDVFEIWGPGSGIEHWTSVCMISICSEKAGQTSPPPFRAGETEPGKDSSHLPRFSQSASDSAKTRAWIFLLMVQASIEPFSGHLLKSWVNATWLPCWFLFRWWGFPKAGKSQRAARLSPASS